MFGVAGCMTGLAWLAEEDAKAYVSKDLLPQLVKGIALCLLLALCAGCAFDPQTGARPIQSTTPTSSILPGFSSPPVSPLPSQTGVSIADLCQTPLPTDWASSLATSTVARGAGISVAPVTALGDKVVVRVSSGSSSWVEERSGSRARRVMTLTDVNDVYQAEYVGNDLVLYAFDNPDLDSPFTLFHWSSKTGGVTKIGASARDPQGRSIATPFIRPLVVGPYVYWSQTLSSDPARTVTFRYDTTSGANLQASANFGLTPVALGSDMLLQPVVDDPRGQRYFKALRLDLSPADLPAALAGVTGVNSVASDGTTVVWTTGSDFEYWRQGWSAPRLLRTTFGPLWETTVSGDIATFSSTARTVVVDLRSGAWTPVTTEYGSSSAVNGWLIVGDPPAVKGASPDSHLVKIASLSPLPSC
jgi:hypothetical protein